MSQQGQTRSAGGTFSATTAPAPRSVTDAVIPVHGFSGIFSIVRERGWPLAELFPSFAFDADGAPLPGQRLSYQQAREAILNVGRRIGDDLAVFSGARKSIASLGLLGPGLLAHASLGEALRFGLEYQGVAGSLLRLTLETDETEAAIVCSELFEERELGQFLQIDHLLTVANVIRHAPCPRQLPLRLELVGALTPDTAALLHSLLECPVVPHCARARLVYPRAHLATPLHFPDQMAVSMWRQICQREQDSLGAPPRAGMAGHLFASDGSLNSRNAIAARLGISERSLQRRFASEGIRYAELANLANMEQAKRALLAGATTEEIAARLGYADARSLRRAFVRATGQTPSQFRAGAEKHEKS